MYVYNFNITSGDILGGDILGGDILGGDIDIKNFTNNSNSTNYGSSSLWSTWLLDKDGIAEGKSTILGGNKIAFYGIHSIGLITILLSLISCSAVIYTVIRHTKKIDQWDFSDRFPLYLAVSDVLWGLSNLSGDHVVLMIYQRYPGKFVASLLATNLFFFFGYQQLMNAGLSLYTYLKVVRRVSMGLGHLEWRLHATVLSLLISQIIMYWLLGAFGNGGFWFFHDLSTKSGSILSGVVCFICSVHAGLTLFAYRAIQNVISDHKKVFSYFESPVPSQSPIIPPKASHETEANNVNHVKPGRIHSYTHQETYSTATNCLTTFIYISLFLYIPLALVCWCGWAFSCFGYIEPFSALGVTIWANSGGWVNAWGYFHNRKIKEERKARVNNLRAQNSNSLSLP